MKLLTEKYFKEYKEKNKNNIFKFFEKADLKGNGRIARLLEKWFLSMFIGEKAWIMKSEKYYKENRSYYYKHINLGVNYYEVNMDKCIPFLGMLAKAAV